MRNPFVRWFRWLRARITRNRVPSTKRCPKCRSDVLVLFTSTNLKICNNCKHEFAWHLDPGQTALHAPSRADRKQPKEAAQA